MISIFHNISCIDFIDITSLTDAIDGRRGGLSRVRSKRTRNLTNRRVATVMHMIAFGILAGDGSKHVIKCSIFVLYPSPKSSQA
jgi:hypothetical protein